MKKIFYIVLFCVLSVVANAQFPLNATTGTNTSGVLTRGRATIDSLLQINSTCFSDTTIANRGRIDEIPGAMIRTCNNLIWLRNNAATRWVSLATGARLDSLTAINDSAWIVCYNDGSCDTISFNNNNVFLTVNNAFGGCNNLLSGGVVTAANPTVNLVFDVTAADYTIGCKAYHTSLSQVTLANGDATFGRFDVVAVDTNNAVIVIQGTPSSDPQVPQVNTSSQLALTTILVPAGATTAVQLGITQTVIYDQNLGTPTEWNGASTAWTLDLNNTSFPFHLTKDAFYSGSTGSTSQTSFTTTDTMRNGQFDVFKFYIRLTDVWATGMGFDISFYHGTTKVTNSVILQNNSYGFDQTVTGSYQTIAIPMANWVFTDSIFFSVVIKPLATPFASKDFRLDWIQLQGGINQALGGSSGLYIWNQYSLAQPANYWIAGSAKVQGGIISTDINYLGSERYGLNANAAGVYATAIGAYTNATAEGAFIGGSQSSGKGIVIGYGKSSNSSSNASIGGTTTGTGNSLLGIDGTITGNDNVKIGESGTVTGSRNVNIGYNISHSFSNTISLGYQGVPTASNQFIIASNATRFTFPGVSRGVANYVLTDSLGDGSYWVARPVSGGVTAANNGTSLSSTTVQLGQDVGAVGNPAILLSSREIPMGGFTLSLNASATQSVNIFQTKNINGQIRARINADSASFSNDGGYTASEQFGNLSQVLGINALAVGSNAIAREQDVVIGRFAHNNGVGSSSKVLVGKSSLSSGSGIGEVIIGTGAESQGAGGGSNVIVGTQATTNNSGVVDVGYAAVVNGQNATGVGQQVNIASGHTYSQAYGAFAATSAANQVVFGGAVNGGFIGVNAFYFGSGVVNVSGGVIDDISFNPTGSFGSNIAGKDFYINGAKRTGNSTTGGTIIFQTSTAGASGSTLQTLASRIQINNSGILAYNGVMPTSGSGGTDSAIFRNSSTGQYYLAPGSAVITADNGLSKSTATNVQLGSSSINGSYLLHDTHINGSALYFLALDSIYFNTYNYAGSSYSQLQSTGSSALMQANNSSLQRGTSLTSGINTVDITTTNGSNSNGRLNIPSLYKTLTEATATTFVIINIPSGSVGGGEILITVEANDATDYQARTLRFVWSAVNKSGTTTVQISTPEELVAVSSGTLTVTITAVDGGSGDISFKANATSSLSQTILRSNCIIVQNFGGSILAQ